MVTSTEDGRHPVCAGCGEKIDHDYNTVLRSEGLYHKDCHEDRYGREAALDKSQQRKWDEITWLRENEEKERDGLLETWANFDKRPPNAHGGRRIA